MRKYDLRVKLYADPAPFVEAMNRAARIVEKLRRVAPWLLEGAPDAHHPRPLTIDGHAYHRRTRSRRRRR